MALNVKVLKNFISNKVMHLLDTINFGIRVGATYYYHLHFTNGETEILRGQLNYQRVIKYLQQVWPYIS